MSLWRVNIHDAAAAPTAALPEFAALASELPPLLVPVALQVVEFLGAFLPVAAAAAAGGFMVCFARCGRATP